jgi:hypothetical protein
MGSPGTLSQLSSLFSTYPTNSMKETVLLVRY